MRKLSIKTTKARGDGRTDDEGARARRTQVKQFYYCVANADFMLNDENNEHFPEILRERRRFFKEKSKPQDFWIVPNPAFLDAMPDVKKKIRQPCVAVVTTDKVWNDFVKLRMDRVYKGGVEGAVCDILKSSAAIDPNAFPAPTNWTAPYSQVRRGLVERLRAQRWLLIFFSASRRVSRPLSVS